MKPIIVLLFFVCLCGNVFSQDKLDSAHVKSTAENTNLITKRAIPKRVLSPMHVPVVYTFIGNGNWSDPANWDANGVPPDETSPDSKIYINNVPGGMCYLDVPYVVKSGTLPTSLIVFTGSNLVIPGNLIVK